MNILIRTPRQNQIHFRINWVSITTKLDYKKLIFWLSIINNQIMNPNITRDLVKVSRKSVPKDIIYQQVEDYINFVDKYHFICLSNVCDALIDLFLNTYSDLIIQKESNPDINPRIIHFFINISHPHKYNPVSAKTTLLALANNFLLKTKSFIQNYNDHRHFLHFSLSMRW